MNQFKKEIKEILGKYLNSTLVGEIMGKSPHHKVRQVAGIELLEHLPVKEVVNIFKSLNWEDWNELITTNHLQALVVYRNQKNMSGMTTDRILFYIASEKYGEFSNLYPARVFFNGTVWDSTESAYQFYKFKDAKLGAWIIQAPRQSIMAKLSHMFNTEHYTKLYVRDDWEDFKVSLMRELNIAKYEQHPKLAALLLGTGDQIIVENSSIDWFWGCGSDGSGKNMLGKILMEVRTKLQNDLIT